MAGLRGVLLASLLVAMALGGCIGDLADERLDPASSPDAERALEPTQYEAVGDGLARIHRDGYGVPHVYGDTDEAVMWGLGYAQGEDRLWQLELLRRAGKGRLAEVLGPAFLDMDVATRTLGMSEEGRWQAFERLTPDDQNLLERYRDGINAALVEALTDPTRLPVELAALTDPPEPWTVTDTIAVAELALGGFGEFGGTELSNARLYASLVARFGEDEARRLFDDAVQVAARDAPTSIHPDDLSYPAPEVPAALPKTQAALLTPSILAAGHEADRLVAALDEGLARLGFPTSLGSNAVLVSGEHTESGRPLLWGGPQTGHSLPSFWWEAGLHGGSFDVVGAGVPGTGGLVIGHTGHAAWTVTSGYSDTVDLFVEELDPADRTRYRTADGWAAMDRRVETLLVRPQADDPLAEPALVVREVFHTHHGPVVAFTEDGRHAIVRAAAQRPIDIASMVCWLRLGATTSYDAFAACMDRMDSNFNLFYADTTGRIAYHHVGKVPVRAPGFDPRFPLPGTGEAEWEGFVPPDQMPHVVDPTPGALVNWNNMPARNWPDGDQARAWTVAHRGGGLQRILDRALDDGAKLSLDELQALNEEAATTDVHAFLVRPLLRDAPPSPGRAAMLAWVDAGAPIRDDDGDGRVDAPAVAAYEAFVATLAERVLADELGEWFVPLFFPTEPITGNADDHGSFAATTSLLVRAMTGELGGDWLDDRDTPEREAAADHAAAAMAVAEDALAEGRPMLEHRFAPFGAASTEDVPRMDRGSVNLFVALTEPPTGRLVLPPGNSGLVTASMLAGLQENRHLDDQVALYAAFEAKRLAFTLPAVEAVSEAVRDLRTLGPVDVPLRFPAPARQALNATGSPAVSLLGDVSTG